MIQWLETLGSSASTRPPLPRAPAARRRRFDSQLSSPFPFLSHPPFSFDAQTILLPRVAAHLRRRAAPPPAAAAHDGCRCCPPLEARGCPTARTRLPKPAGAEAASPGMDAPAASLTDAAATLAGRRYSSSRRPRLSAAAHLALRLPHEAPSTRRRTAVSNTSSPPWI
ncbi:hypothetical protein PVAP13_8KG373902 [Panicum virgatum]|uniref:Uncharacterized protein n=1 Tax=Panicum virgatum TaxID=38727 RepID=A0A8T0PS34_PANVG|nr:hypothetical protein PVAP13_8KG373902 [Panicum virgatum]